MIVKMNDKYIAGFFDGEGCVMLRPKSTGRLMARITLVQHNPEILEKIQKYLGFGHVSKPSSTGQFTLIFAALEEVEAFAKRIAPYTSIKQDQLNLVEKFAQLCLNQGRPLLTEELEARWKLYKQFLLLRKHHKQHTFYEKTKEKLDAGFRNVERSSQRARTRLMEEQ